MTIFNEEIEDEQDYEYDEFDKVDSMIDNLKEENIFNLKQMQDIIIKNQRLKIKNKKINKIISWFLFNKKEIKEFFLTILVCVIAFGILLITALITL